MKTLGINIKSTSALNGSTEHYQHYCNEYERIKELAENAKGKEKKDLYLELDCVVMILEDYIP